jgi:hypothetical protein
MSLAVEFRQKAAVIWHIQRIKRMVREIAGLGPHTLVSVVEITCDDPACPGPATQITILGLDLKRNALVIHRPAAKVAAADLQMLRG